MTTHTDRIRQMAQEAGFSLGSWSDRGAVITADHSIDVTEWITRFAQLIAEDCARIADESEPRRGVGDDIRYEYSLKD